MFMTFEQIGQKLKTTRDTLGLSLAQVHEKTKIPFSHLESIENGVTDDLPEPVYVAGFIKRFGDCIGLNGQELADSYRHGDNPPQQNGIRFNFLSHSPKEEQPVASTNPTYFQRSAIEPPPPNLLKSILFYTFWAVVVLALVIFLVSRQQNLESAQQDASILTLKDSAAKFNAPPTTIAPTEAPNTNLPAESVSSDARVTLTANQHVWVEVKSTDTGEVKYTGFLETGDRRDFQDPQGLRIIAGNGGSLTIAKDGKTESFGEAGKKTERVFLAKAPSTESTTSPETKTTVTTPATNTPAPTPTLVKKIAKKPAPSKPYNFSTHQYIPGESLGNGSKGLDVPYRY